MSKADRLLEEIGYLKKETDFYVRYFRIINGQPIWVIEVSKVYKEYYAHDNVEEDGLIGDLVSIGIKEHLALNEKMKEFGWI